MTDANAAPDSRSFAPAGVRVPEHPNYGNPNEPLSFGSGPVTVSIADRSFHGTAEAGLRWAPEPQVVIQATLPDAGFSVLNLEHTAITFPAQAQSVDVVAVGRSVPAPALLDAQPRSLLRPLAGMRPATRVNFFVANLVDFATLVTLPDGQRRAVYDIELAASPWRVQLCAAPDHYARTKRLRETGGFALTHSGRIERVDDAPFSSEEANDVLWAVGNFLSFARGFRTGPVLPVGVAADGTRAWEDWQLGMLDRWQVVYSWFYPPSGDLLADVFPGFMACWSSERWHRPLQSALYWYLHSNTTAGGLDGAIILTRSALELLGWVTIVADRALVSADGFDRLKGIDQLRLLLSVLGIPKAIPASLPSLNAAARGQNWEDGPQALTEMRNAIVHGSLKLFERRLRLTPDVLRDAWMLGQWYVDLALLHAFGHAGHYVNRTSSSYERVPWA